MRISKRGVDLIKKYEGCGLTAYKPVAEEQYYTIGWGHYGPDVKPGQTITQAEADLIFIQDIPNYEAYVNNKMFVPQLDKLNQAQYDALVSICYNAGCGNLKKLCANRTVEQIGAVIPSFCIHGANGKILDGLVRRRAEEAALFNGNGEINVMDNKTFIMALQAFLNAKGFDCGAVDGIVGPKTLNGVTSWLTSLK